MGAVVQTEVGAEGGAVVEVKVRGSLRGFSTRVGLIICAIVNER